MKKLFYILLLSCCTQLYYAQAGDTLYLNYFSQNPFAFSENGNLKGIEIEIMNEYITWLKTKKKLNPILKPVPYGTFEQLYGSIKSAKKNTVGLGSVTVNLDRTKEIDFCSPYMKDVAFCVTNGHAPDVKTKTRDEVIKAMGSMSAVTINNTSLNRYVVELKRLYVQDLKINYVSEETKILEEISKNVLNFGYVNAVSFWFYLKNNPQKFLKTQKVLSQSRDELAFILPKGSPHKALFNEFFIGPAGFRTTAAYKAILEKYLGSYMTQNMAIN